MKDTKKTIYDLIELMSLDPDQKSRLNTLLKIVYSEKINFIDMYDILYSLEKDYDINNLPYIYEKMCKTKTN